MSPIEHHPGFDLLQALRWRLPAKEMLADQMIAHSRPQLEPWGSQQNDQKQGRDLVN
jgi:hypothetical protein